MTVRVSKPAFNLREKVTELDRPVGLHGNEILKSETPQDTFDLVGTGRKNLVINGGMSVSQRHGTSETTPGHTDFGPDRMRFDLSQSSKFKVQQVTDAPAGFSHSMKVTSLSAYSSGSSDYFLLQNMIEGTDSARLRWGTSEAQTITLSFYVKSSLVGVYACGIRNNPYNRANTQTYTINNANTWERKTVTFTGDTSGSWNVDTNAGLKINFDLGSGSNFQAASTGTWLATNDFITSDSVKVVGTNAATWYITGIQLETGSLSTPFEHHAITDELALCQRYYWKLDDGSNQAGAQWLYVIGDGGNMQYRRATVNHPVPMRGSPSVTNISLTNNGSTVGVQFNGNHTTTIYANGIGGGITEVRYAEFDVEL